MHANGSQRSHAAQPFHPMRLPGRRVVITGASSGVGAAAVPLFAREGARLALMARNEDALRDVADRHAPDALVIGVDLADRLSAEHAVKRACRDLGGLDVLVSNHAAAVFGHLLEVHPDDFERTVTVTFGGAVNVIRAALPELRRSKGTVVATGSLMARLPLPGWSSYAAAKHALRGFLNSLRIEERERRSGVRVAMLHPGPIDTPLYGRCSSATGLQPRFPPDAYSAGTVAQGLVELAVKPREEVVLGGSTRCLDLIFAVARPWAEKALLLIDRWYRSGEEAASSPGSLWQPPTRTQTSGGGRNRGSILAPAQLGRRMPASPQAPVTLLRNLAGAGVRAVRIRPVLGRGVGESPPPEHSLREPPPPAAVPGGRPQRQRITTPW